MAHARIAQRAGGRGARPCARGISRGSRRLGRRASPRRDRALLERALASDGWSAFAVGVLFLAFYAATISPPTPYAEPVQQAYAFLHGRTWVDAPGYMEHIVWHGKSYLLHPPLAALMTLPAVAIWGLAANQTAISVVVGAVSLGLVWRLLGKIGLGVGGARMADAFLRRRYDVLV